MASAQELHSELISIAICLYNGPSRGSYLAGLSLA